MAKVLIGCETSGIVREAFLALGHDAWSCDLLPSDTQTNRHIQDDIRNVMMMDDWDLMAVMHPPCTRLCNAGAWCLTGKRLPKKQPSYPADWDNYTDEMKRAWLWLDLERGAALFSDVWNVAHIPCVGVENPIMHKHAKARIRNYREFSQSIQPWQCGTEENGPDNVTKRTCLWLRNLPKLVATGTLDGSTARADVYKATPGPNRWKTRSKFYPGLAAAMADQWGSFVEQNRSQLAA